MTTRTEVETNKTILLVSIVKKLMKRYKRNVVMVRVLEKFVTATVVIMHLVYGRSMIILAATVTEIRILP